jgi:hypothetical protein
MVEKMKQIKPLHIILLIIVIVAFVVRIIGIPYGIPQQYIADEFVQVAIGLKMLDERALIPNFPDIFYHQPLSAYISTIGIGSYLGWQMITGVFENLAVMREFYSINSSLLLIVPRLLSALGGALTVWLLYFIGRDLFNKRVGLIAAFFAVFELMLVFINHSGRVWGYMTVFIALALWASIKLFKKDSSKNYILATGATLLAAANTLPGIFTFVPTFFTRFKWRNKKIWYAMGVLVAGVVAILAISPRGLGALFFRFQKLSGSVFVEKLTGYMLEYEVVSTPLFNRIFDTPITLFNYAPIYMVLFTVGALLLWKENKKTFWFLISFPIVYYFFIGPFFTFGWVARTLVPLMIYVLLFAAYAVEKLTTKLKTHALIVVVLLLSTPSIVSSIALDIKLLKEDTRTSAIEWTYENLPENTRLIIYSSTNETINQSREVLEIIQSVAPQKLNTRQRTLLMGNDNLYPSPQYFAWDIRHIKRDEVSENFFAEQNFTHYMRVRWRNVDQELYDDLIENDFTDKILIAQFSPFESEEYSAKDFGNVHNMTNPLRALTHTTQFGPIVEIYEITF